MKTNLQRIALVSLASLLLATFAFAEPAPFPGILKNARYVYVTSYDGSQYNPNILPDDRAAIGEVQDSLHSWGRYIVVQEPRFADMMIVVQRRGSEDVLAVYDTKVNDGAMYLWRVMGRGGLDKNEMPLFAEFRQSVEKMESAKK